MSEVVTLDSGEMMQAVVIGCLRRISALHRNRPEPHGSPSDAWLTDIGSSAAELAVAKYLEMYWQALAPNGDLRRLNGDVSGYQVRHTLRLDGRLILHREDPADRIFVLALGAPPRLTLAGYLLARDGQLDRYWEEFTGRPCFFVPQKELEDVSRLSSVLGSR